MKKYKVFNLGFLVILTCLWLSACGEATPGTTNQNQNTTGPTTAATSPTATSAAAPTTTPVNQLPTATPLPTPTTAPVATNTPVPSATAIAIPTATSAPPTPTSQPTSAPATPTSLPTSLPATSTTAASTPSTAGASVTSFNLLALEDVTLTAGGSQINGPVAAGRDASFVNYNLATGQPGGADNVLVGRNLKLRGGQVKGNAVYGTAKTIEGTNFDQGQAIQRSNPLSVDGLRSYTENVALMWKNQGGTSLTTQYTNYILSAGPGTSYFRLKGSELANATSLQIEAPSDGTIILNVEGTSIQLHNMGINLSGGIDRQHLAFNFYEASSLKITGVQVEGTVWAPKAAVNFTNGAQRGTLVAKSLVGGSVSFEYDPFQGTLPQ